MQSNAFMFTRMTTAVVTEVRLMSTFYSNLEEERKMRRRRTETSVDCRKCCKNASKTSHMFGFAGLEYVESAGEGERGLSVLERVGTV